MTKRNLRRFRNSRTNHLAACCLLFAVMAVGCAQNAEEALEGPATEASEERTTATRAGTTVQATTVVGATAAQRTKENQGDTRQQTVQQTITVRITGTEGLAFTGRLGSTQGLRVVDGSVPKEYEIPFGGAAVTVTLRKQESGEGTLGVEVVRGAEVLVDKETTSTTGVLNSFWTPRQQGD
ncbi:hypothetical protein BH23ACT11_BH23ACT11_18560 [soil metagenome]